MDIDSEGLVVSVGGEPRTQILELLRDAGVQVNLHGQTLLGHPAFDDPPQRTMRFVERTVEQLGLPHGGTHSQILDSAPRLGLTLAPLVAGPYLRLALTDQTEAPDSVLSAGRPPTGAIHIASAPINDDVEYPKGFYLRVVDRQMWLRGYRCDDAYVCGPKQRFAFVVSPPVDTAI